MIRDKLDLAIDKAIKYKYKNISLAKRNIKISLFFKRINKDGTSNLSKKEKGELLSLLNSD